MEGGVLTAASGRIELGAAAETEIDITPAGAGFALSYAEDANFQPIELSQASLLDVGGDAGSIQVRGESLRVLGASILLLRHEGAQMGGSLDVRVTDAIEVSDVVPLPGGLTRSNIFAQSTGAGDGGSINVSARSVLVDNGASILSVNSGSGTGADINVVATDFVRVSSPPTTPLQPVLETNTFAPGNAGDLSIATQRLMIEGGVVASETIGSGAGGRVVIHASESVEVTGVLNSGVQSLITASAFSSGDAGSIEVYSPRVVVRDGALISSANLALGSAGSVLIQAPESVEISGTSRVTGGPSQISTSTVVVSEFVREIFGLPEVPIGDAGSTVVQTENLVIDGASLRAFNQGLGDAGTIAVDAENIRVRNGGSILATAVSGQGGSIALNANDRLRLRGSSQISASVEDLGNGGTIAISAEDIAVRQGSNITADAANGNGGTIQIFAEDLRVSPGQITASATEFGNGGTIAIAAEDIAFRQGSSIAVNAVDGNGGTIAIAAEDIAVRQGSSIAANTVNGNGGLVQIVVEDLSVSPNSSITATSEFGTDGTVAIIESDDGFAEAFLQLPEGVANFPEEVSSIISLFEGDRCARSSSEAADDLFVEARGWQHDRNGNVLLTAEPIDASCAIATR